MIISKKIILLLQLIFISLRVVGSQCFQDSRSLSEYLLSQENKLIFTCKLVKYIPKEPLTEKPITNKNGITLGGSRPDYQDYVFVAQIIKTYFGTIDTSHILIHSESQYLLGDSFLIYTVSNKNYYSFNNIYCVQRTKFYRDASEFELKTLTSLSNIIKNRKTKNCEIKNGEILISKGKFKKGKPVKTWIHNYDNGKLKTKINFENKNEFTFYANGRKQVEKIYLKDTLCYFHYKNNSSNCIENIEKDLPLEISKSQKWYFETYENCKIKQKHTQENGVGMIGEYVEFYENGNIKIKGIYEKGLKIGRWFEYNENGKLINEKTY